jgi:hypothetical protein
LIPTLKVFLNRLNTKKPRSEDRGFLISAFLLSALSAGADYKLVATLLKVVFRLVPRVVMALMMTTATRAAIKPYSMAVTPDSSRKRFTRVVIVWSLHVNGG